MGYFVPEFPVLQAHIGTVLKFRTHSRQLVYRGSYATIARTVVGGFCGGECGGSASPAVQKGNVHRIGYSVAIPAQQNNDIPARYELIIVDNFKYRTRRPFRMSFVTRFAVRLYCYCSSSFILNSSLASANSSAVGNRHFAMKPRKKNCFSLQNTLRLGIMLLIAIDLFTVGVEGARSSQDYRIVSKPRSKPREIRGFKPASMSTAIGFGKRGNNVLQPSKPYRHDALMLYTPMDTSQRSPIEHLVQLLNLRPELERALRKFLLTDEENVRPSVGQHYKENRNDIIDYYNE